MPFADEVELFADAEAPDEVRGRRRRRDILEPEAAEPTAAQKRMKHARSCIKRPSSAPGASMRRPAAATSSSMPMRRPTAEEVRRQHHVPAVVLASLSKPFATRSGQDDLWPIMPYVGRALKVLPRGDGLSSAGKLMKWMSSSDNYHVVTNTSLLQQFGGYYQKTRDAIRVAANCVIQNERMARRLLEQVLVANLQAAALVCYVDFDRSDETRLIIAHSTPQQNKRMRTHATLAIQDMQSEAIRLFDAALTPNKAQTQAPVKILQSEDSFALLVQLPNGRLARFEGNTLNWCQSLESTKAETLLEGDRRRTGRTEHSGNFRTKTRASCLDQASSNKRWRRASTSEASLIGNDQEGWEHVEFDCLIHIDQNNINRVLDFDETSAAIKGQIHYALVFESAEAWSSFQMVLWQEVYDSVEVVWGSPPEAGKHYRKHLLRLCLTRVGRIAEKLTYS